MRPYTLEEFPYQRLQAQVQPLSGAYLIMVWWYVEICTPSTHHSMGVLTSEIDCCRHKSHKWSYSCRQGATAFSLKTPLIVLPNFKQNCEKLHFISPNIWCAGAGTAADTEFTTALISSNLELHSLSTGRTPRVVTVMTLLKQHLFRYQGHIGAYLVVAGVDPTGVGLFTVHAHGSTDKLPYVTMGSGSLAAMAVFESTWKKNCNREEAIKICSEAIMAGIFNDLGSGSNVDVCVIEKDKPTQLMRNYIKPNERVKKERNYKFARGTTAVLNEKVITKEEIGRYVTVHEIGSGSDSDSMVVVEKMDVDEV